VNSPAACDRFGRFAARISVFAGCRWGFIVAGLFIVAWAVYGPFAHFSDTWQLVVNTGTSIVTFMMVFLIQNTQNRDARAINLKLDELIRAVDNARNHMINIEKLSDAELDLLEQQFSRLRLKHEHEREQIGIAAD
jgi:low affinity Fe/Cu permease